MLRAASVGLIWTGNSSSSTNLADNITHPSNSGTWHIGDLVPGNPGTKSANGVWDALAAWVGKTVSIPLWDTVSGTGTNTKYRICGFAEFTVLSASKANKMITGTFLRTLKRGDTVGSGADFGVRDIRFVK